MNIASINPTTGKIIRAHTQMSQSNVETIVANNYTAQQQWQNLDPSIRRESLFEISKNIQQDLEVNAQLITQEMGKPISQARDELKKCALLCEYYAESLETFLQPIQPNTDVNGFSIPRPIGNILAIMPWNFPFWQAIRAIIPNLALGNGVLFKPAPNVVGCGIALEKILHRSLPYPIMHTLIIDEHQTTQLIAHPNIMGVTLTGSQRAGRSVAAQAGQFLKPVTLELGGNDPYLVLEDADLDAAATTLVNNRFMNAGQVCVSPKRIIVPQTIFDAFQERILTLVKDYQVGDPTLTETRLGPMAREDVRAHIHQQVQTALQEGANCLIGGHHIKGPGYFYAPTVLSAIKPGTTPFNEELFGPVISLIIAENETHAIELANMSQFGLGGGVFSKDTEKALNIIQNKLNIGIGSINNTVRSNPAIPFGGIKGSGYGRECGQLGFQAFANLKSINL